MLRTIQRWNNSQRYSTCALNSHVPSGLRFDLSGIDTLVYLGTHEGRGYIELRVDVPEGLTLQLERSLVKATTRGPDGVAGSDFPSVSLVDTPIVNAFIPCLTCGPDNCLPPSPSSAADCRRATDHLVFTMVRHLLM